MITLPDMRQTDDFGCGDTVYRSIMRLLRRPAERQSLSDPLTGISPDGLEAAFRRAGLDVLSGVMTVADLKHFAGTGRPVACPIALHGGHWVTVLGVTRNRVHFHCPLEGHRALSVADWHPIWRDNTRAGHVYERWGIAVGGYEVGGHSL